MRGRSAVRPADSEADDGTGRPIERQRRTASPEALYLAIFVIAPFAYFYMPGELFHDDAATTTSQISADTGLFKAGMIAETIIVGIEIVARRAALATLSAGQQVARHCRPRSPEVGEALIQAVNVLLAGAVLIAVERARPVRALRRRTDPKWSGCSWTPSRFGAMVWGLLFGFHLLLLGFLVRRSDLMPRWIGSFLMVGVGRDTSRRATPTSSTPTSTGSSRAGHRAVGPR